MIPPTPEWLTPIIDAIEQRFGVRVVRSIEVLVEEAAEELLAEHQLTPTKLASRLTRAGDADPVVARMLRAISVGETYFFRLPRQLAALERLVADQLVPLKRSRGDLILRAWSAGCSTGEEAYTVAAMLSTIAPGFRIEVIGSDINEDALATGRKGLYRTRSVRTPLTPSVGLIQTSDGWAVEPRLKDMVRFVRHNLTTDPLPAPELGLGGFDIILLRNVLIYFSAAHGQAVLNGIETAAAPTSIVVLTPVEFRGGVTLRGFRHQGQAVFWRGPEQRKDEAPPRPSAPPVPIPSRPQVIRPSAPPPAPLPRPSPPTKPTISSLLSQSQAAADQGDLETALSFVGQAAKVDPHSLAVRHAWGALLLQSNDMAGARQQLERAIGLDGSHGPSHLLLGNAYDGLGDRRTAMGHWGTAQALFASLAPDTIIPELGVNARVAERLALDEQQPRIGSRR